MRRFAVNVDPDEGDLKLIDGEQLATRLKGVKYDYRQASEFTGTNHELAGSNLTDAVLCVLVALLVGEQLLAYSASYHSAARKDGAHEPELPAPGRCDHAHLVELGAFKPKLIGWRR